MQDLQAHGGQPEQVGHVCMDMSAAFAKGVRQSMPRAAISYTTASTWWRWSTGMARMALEQAISPDWVDQMFEENRQRQYPRELMVSTIVELIALVTLGLRPSVHAAARQWKDLPVSFAALYDKLKRTEPAVLQALVRGSAERLLPVAAELSGPSSLPGWQLRIVDGNHLPASEKRLKPLRGYRGAALPGHSLVLCDPDLGQVCDIVACEDEYESGHVGVQPLVESVRRGQLWISDRHFCTPTIMQSLDKTGAIFVVREHTNHPHVIRQGDWIGPVRIETGWMREQTIDARTERDALGEQSASPLWRRLEIELDTPTESGETVIRLWTNLPAEIDAASIAALQRKRWRIETMFQYLESVLHSEIKTLGHPRAALLGFTVALLAYNVLALLPRAVEKAHSREHPQLEASIFHLAVQVKIGYEGMLTAVPAEHWPAAPQSPKSLAQNLPRLARGISPRQVATSKRGPKIKKPKTCVDASIARGHVSTARVLRRARVG